MSASFTPLTFLLPAALACAVVCATPIAAQTPATSSANTLETAALQETNALNALLSEVRLLRIVLQNTNAGAKRIQLAIERIRLQQERVDKLTRDLDETRNILAENKATQTRLNETLKEMERQIRQENFPVRRAELERQLRVTQIEIEPLGIRESRLKDRESQLMALLQYEQARLLEFNGKLDELEREFDAQATLEKVSAEKAAGPERKRR